jgi:adhesin transport system outer membrane protein
MARRKSIGVVAGSLLALGVTLAGQARAEGISLAEAARLALERSPEVGQADARVGAADAAVDQTRRQWFPTVTAEGVIGLRRLENDARNRLGLSAINEKPGYGGLSLNQPIYDMGRRQNQLAIQKARREATREDREFAAEQATFNVARAYLRVVLAERLAAAASDNMAFHDQMAADMREGVSRGAMSVSERQQADERRQAARVRLADAELDLAESRNLFAALVGKAPEGLALPGDAVAALPVDLAGLVDLAAKADPRVLSAEHDVRQTEAMVRKARSDGLPSLDGQASARTGKDFDGFRGRTEDYSALMTLRWQFFDGGVNAARVREARYKNEEAIQALAQARRDSEREARDGWDGVRAWRAKFEDQSTRATVAQDVLTSYRAQFGIGRRSLLDVLDAQNALFSATGEVEVSRVSLMLAQYALLAQTNRLRDHLGAGQARSTMGPN